MIQKFVDRFMDRKSDISARFREKHPDTYKDIVKIVVESVSEDGGYDCGEMDPDRIHVIDDGDYQGTLLFIIGAKGYQPSNYWSVFVNYGSCSGCDLLQSIHEYSSEAPTDSQVEDYMTLALHIVQGLKVVGEPS